MPNTTEPSAVGVFDDLEKAQQTIDELRHAGFQPEEIGIIGHVGSEQHAVPVPPRMKAPEENAMNGVISGGFWGGLIGLLVITIIPGLGLLSGAGRWFEIVGGAVLGAALGGPCSLSAAWFFLGPWPGFTKANWKKAASS